MCANFVEGESSLADRGREWVSDDNVNNNIHIIIVDLVAFPLLQSSLLLAGNMSSILGESTALNRQPRSPFKPSAKPTSRKSLSALQGEPTNAQTMMDLAVQAKTVEEGGEKRKRAYSVGGVQGQGKNQLSPRSQARRMAVSFV
jgi:hypothetical protein